MSDNTLTGQPKCTCLSLYFICHCATTKVVIIQCPNPICEITNDHVLPEIYWNVYPTRLQEPPEDPPCEASRSWTFHPWTKRSGKPLEQAIDVPSASPTCWWNMNPRVCWNKWIFRWIMSISKGFSLSIKQQALRGSCLPPLQLASGCCCVSAVFFLSGASRQAEVVSRHCFERHRLIVWNHAFYIRERYIYNISIGENEFLDIFLCQCNKSFAAGWKPDKTPSAIGNQMRPNRQLFF